MKRITILSCALPLLLAAAACVASKSANPLSPTVAGPIPGVGITPPAIVQPKDNLYIGAEQQPITLMLQNASTNGERPLSYRFELATDADFNNKIFTREGITPGDGGRTSLRLPDPLGTGRTYYWRARAQDGANTGPFSGLAIFTVFTPSVIGAPELVAPINNVLTSNGRPSFVMGNATRSGQVGSLTYIIEVSTNDAFTNNVAIWSLAEQPNQTTLNAPGELPPDKQLFWHARAFNQSNSGPWSSTAVFRTPVVALGGPVPVSPVDHAVTSNVHPSFVFSNATRSGPVGALTYILEIATNDSFANKIAVWTVAEQPNQTTLNAPVDLPAGSQLFWHVRAFDQSNSNAGPFSSTEAFQTPAPGAPPSSGGGGGTIGGGNWQSCGSTPGAELVDCVREAVYRNSTIEDAFAVTKRVAWLLRGGGAGLLIKNGGENIIDWQGYSFSISRICYPDGHIFKILSDAGPGGANGATWGDNGFVDAALYVPAIDPSKP